MIEIFPPLSFTSNRSGGSSSWDNIFFVCLSLFRTWRKLVTLSCSPELWGRGGAGGGGRKGAGVIESSPLVSEISLVALADIADGEAGVISPRMLGRIIEDAAIVRFLSSLHRCHRYFDVTSHQNKLVDMYTRVHCGDTLVSTALGCVQS